MLIRDVQRKYHTNPSRLKMKCRMRSGASISFAPWSRLSMGWTSFQLNCSKLGFVLYRQTRLPRAISLWHFQEAKWRLLKAEFQFGECEMKSFVSTIVEGHVWNCFEETSKERTTAESFVIKGNHQSVNFGHLSNHLGVFKNEEFPQYLAIYWFEEGLIGQEEVPTLITQSICGTMSVKSLLYASKSLASFAVSWWIHLFLTFASFRCLSKLYHTCKYKTFRHCTCTLFLNGKEFLSNRFCAAFFCVIFALWSTEDRKAAMHFDFNILNCVQVYMCCCY